ncbi:unnamed protein product [Ranitomeya imitator]|uniref:Reverse transcriptase domain-containing protein n=1 Tax=Ranitomeya imitator TaxID=111125 RepID=A0ABN9KVB7_9NEOB|nr:unnamed protein product [Ranitomeya imitator]
MEPGMYCLRHRLSFPLGSPVNDGISKEEARVRYTSFDRAIFLVKQAGRGALLIKSDIEAAFRLLPIHVECFHLLGCHLEGEYFVDICFLEWLLKWETGLSSSTHYLDNILFVDAGDSQVCQYLLYSFRALTQELGIPLSEDKTEGPVRCLTFLGIEIDTDQIVFRLPVEKVEILQHIGMQVLLGLLMFACKVIPMGRVFTRRLSLGTRGISQPHHFI